MMEKKIKIKRILKRQFTIVHTEKGTHFLEIVQPSNVLNEEHRITIEMPEDQDTIEIIGKYDINNM